MKRRICLLVCVPIVLLCTIVIAQTKNAGPSTRADRIVVEKSKRQMKLMHGSEVLKTYQVALGKQPVGAKNRQGDHKTPEGVYSVDVKKPNSRFHRALHISYP